MILSSIIVYYLDIYNYQRDYINHAKQQLIMGLLQFHNRKNRMYIAKNDLSTNREEKELFDIETFSNIYCNIIL
jgi:hypothetical protein